MSGIGHGDIWPRNVVKGPRGLRLIDFSHAFVHDCLGSVCEELAILQELLDLGRFTLRKRLFGWYMIN
jgi:tRNA A-37 threonylcarbamoyl transferase component Bud32